MTEYGDAVEDEWLIVYMIRQLSRSQANVWARVVDTDGEFLLVEAANVLPKWLSPEIDQNRVWIHKGSLQLIPCSSKEDDTGSRKVISLPEAVEAIKLSGDKLVHSSLVEEEAFFRLNKYPGQVEDSIHYSKVTIPRRLAYVLHALPRSIAPAVEAFYLRDALALKPILSSSAPLKFPPEDMVTVGVRFSKVLFAQLRSQRFETPPRWEKLVPKNHGDSETWEPGQGDADTQKLEAGMKLACGFEMLAARAEKSRSRIVREMALLMEDMAEDGDEALPSNAEIRAWPNADRSDSESWLDINYEDFERELSGQSQKQGQEKGEAGGFGDSQAQDNLRKIVSRFEAFLNDDKAGLDGAELDDMDFDDDDSDDDEEYDSDDDEYEDKQVSFDEEEFSRMMREMMGLPPETSTKPPADKGKQKETTAGDKTKKEEESDSDADLEDIKQLSSQMEAELNKHGALRLDPPKKKRAALKEAARSEDYDDDDDDDGEDDGEDSEEEVDVDYNLAKNLLESFKSQGGMSGPTGNLLGMMGLNLPRDEDDGKDDDDAGPSK